MGIPVLIYGKSGSGKSRSLKSFGADEISLIQVVKKRLPFEKVFTRTIQSADYDYIMAKLQSTSSKAVVIDDAGYLMTNMFMKEHSTPKYGADAFKLYNDIADRFYFLIDTIIGFLPDDTIVYIIMHEETDDSGGTKLLTIGKLLDQKVNIPGMVTIALRCMTGRDRHYFRTQSDGSDISKSPEGMFPLEVENDLKAVDDRIREYYGINKEDTGNE